VNDCPSKKGGHKQKWYITLWSREKKDADNDRKKRQETK